MQKPVDFGKDAFADFLFIAEEWELSDQEQLAMLDFDSTARIERQYLIVYQLRDRFADRVWLIREIYNCLHALLSDKESANTWIRKANSAPLFSGSPAVTLMCRGRKGLQDVSAYLHAVCQGH